jgi:2-polyprenyl-3-methyl-5-hydroxy-6-metoxy-1,4-benzoquinol methylase
MTEHGTAPAEPGYRPALDREKLDAFVKMVSRDIASTMATVMAGIGDRLGLFKQLAADGPATSAELAARAGLDPRYVCEWLGAMAGAGYVAYDPASGRYTLPPEHARVLAEEGGPFFVGGVHQFVPALLAPLDRILEAFRRGGGAPQSAYDDNLWEGMERGNVGWLEHVLVQWALPEMPEVRAMLERGARVADIGCGRGGALIKLAREFPTARCVGYDLFPPTVAAATARAATAGVGDRVRFEARDVSQGLPEQYDLITSFDVVHDAADPLGLMRAVRAGLRPGGIYICFEPASQEKLEERVGGRATFLYSVSVLYCMTTSLSQGGAGLGALGMPESKVRELAAAAGFGAVRRVPLKDALGNDDTFHSMFELRQ